MSYVLENKGYDSDGSCFPDFLGAEDRLLFERLIRFIHEKPGQPFYASAGLTRVTIRANSDPRRRVANSSVMKLVYYIEYSARCPYNSTACEVNTDYSYAITALDRWLATRFGFKGQRAFARAICRAIRAAACQAENHCNSDAILS